MKHLRSLTGKSVLAGGRRIGRVARAGLSPDLLRLSGIWVERGLRGTLFIPAEEISVLGEVSVQADGGGRRRGLGVAPHLIRAVSTDGTRIGAVTDFLIDEVSLAVVAVEVTPGFPEELIRGRYVARSFRPDPAGRRVIIGEENRQERVET